jgi:hypothetical protein
LGAGSEGRSGFGGFVRGVEGNRSSLASVS